MSVRYRNYDWVFDKYRWAEVLRGQDNQDLVAAQELSGLTAAGWWHWLNPKQGTTYEQPGMKNFLAVCNLLHLDPREFFCLDVKGI